MQKTEANKLHYGWIVVLTGVGVLFACLGLGRFSLGMILPSMGDSLSLTYSQMGWIGTLNFTGYMASVIVAGRISRHLGARRTISLGLLCVAVSMGFISRSNGFASVAGCYFMTGVGSGLANVPMMGLISHWFFKKSRGKAAGLILTGNSLGIIFSGMFIPWINMVSGADGWRVCWMYMGCISFFIALLASGLIRNQPLEKGLEPAGSPDLPHPENKPKPAGQVSMNHLGILYGLFGATHVIYITFIVTVLVDERGFGENTAGLFWAVFGCLSLFSGPLFGILSDKIGRKKAIMVAFLSFSASYLIVALSLPNWFLYFSILIFGLTAWSIPTILSAAVGDYMGPDNAAKAFGYITIFCGGGQVIGPALAGGITDYLGSFNAVFYASTVVALLAAGMAGCLKNK